MRATVNQMRWVPIPDILEPEQRENELRPAAGEDGSVLLAARGDGKYLLLAGRDRLNLCRQQGRCFVDALISPTDTLEQRLGSLMDSLVRGKLHYLDEAEAYRSFVRGDGLTTAELAQRTGRSPQTIRRKIRLLNLGAEVCALLREYSLCEGLAELLLRLPGQQGRLRVATHIARQGLSLREAEALIDDVLSRMPIPMTGGRRMKPLMRDYRLYVNAIRDIVEQMRDAGLEADMRVTVGRSAADVRVSVPLFSQQRA